MFWVAGIDEAGRGPLAGPVTAACVCLPAKFSHSGITDSKKLEHAEREKLARAIRKKALAYSVVSVGHHRVDIHNIREATRIAMLLAGQRVAEQLRKKFGEGKLVFLIDGNTPIATSHPQETIIQGDDRITSISAASILAKVARDQIMVMLSSKYEGYGFEQHKGYATKAHQEQIALRGPCRVHRRTFCGVRQHRQGEFNFE